jgi:hypothetical protein
MASRDRRLKPTASGPKTRREERFLWSKVSRARKHARDLGLPQPRRCGGTGVGSGWGAERDFRGSFVAKFEGASVLISGTGPSVAYFVRGTNKSSM